MNNKLSKTLKVINYSLNPLASLRNPLAPLARIKSMLAKQELEKTPYTEVVVNYDSAEIETKCRQLKMLSRLGFYGFGVLILSSLILLGSMSLMAVLSSIVTISFSALFLALSLKYAFLADGVENNQFKYKNPLEFAKQNFGAYVTWLFSDDYQLQSFK